ncbi:hypothetical protein E2C01_024846 [Portunus trituberculatus]|uniref:Uncharacterized protein n=1 Tax=Portunus trituberculatus TaxID=210409 RepID=A0A5B7EBM7_PORTR|nr:hypothetical protein [Portunus trituberculatus]
MAGSPPFAGVTTTITTTTTTTTTTTDHHHHDYHRHCRHCHHHHHNRRLPLTLHAANTQERTDGGREKTPGYHRSTDTLRHQPQHHSTTTAPPRPSPALQNLIKLGVK